MGRVSLCYSIHDPHHQGSGRRISAAGQREKEAALAGAAEIVPQPAAGAVGDLLHRIVDADVEHRRLVHQRGGGGEPEIDLGGGKNVPMSSTDEYDLCTNGVPGTSRKSTWGEGKMSRLVFCIRIGALACRKKFCRSGHGLAYQVTERELHVESLSTDASRRIRRIDVGDCIPDEGKQLAHVLAKGIGCTDAKTLGERWGKRGTGCIGGPGGCAGSSRLPLAFPKT